jgi:hypothetical protein
MAALARIEHQDRDVAVLGERPAGAGQVAAALQPRVQLVEDRAADPPHLEVAEGGLDGAADIRPTNRPTEGGLVGYLPLPTWSR